MLDEGSGRDFFLLEQRRLEEMPPTRCILPRFYSSSVRRTSRVSAGARRFALLCLPPFLCFAA